MPLEAAVSICSWSTTPTFVLDGHTAADPIGGYCQPVSRRRHIFGLVPAAIEA